MPRSFTSGRGGGSGGTGLLNLNGLTADPQTFATGTSGTDFNISSATSTHTFNLPTASGSNRGLLSTSDWTAFTAKPTISSGAGAPGSTPGKVGDIYIDTTGDNAYIAVGTASSADWAQVDGGGGSIGGSTGATDNAIIRANGTGGSTVQSSTATISDNGELTLTSGDAAAMPLQVRSHASQSGNIAEFQNSSGVELNYIDSNGYVRFGANQSGIRPTTSDGHGLIFMGTSGALNMGTGGTYFKARSDGGYGWSSTTDPTQTKDTGLDRASAGVVKVTDGSSGNGSLTVADDAYAAGWNGSTQVPTKNAVYDKIETLPNISSGAGAPASTPSKVGDIYIDTTGDDAYIAVGTASSADWEKTNDGSGSGSPGGSDTQLQYNNSTAFGGISGATSDGTNVTFGSTNLRATRPRVVTSIDDTNGNEVIAVTATGSAVNEITVANAATGNGPTISATGGDTNVDINIVPKGTGTVNFGSGSAGIIKLTEGTPSGAAASRAVLAANSSGNRLELSNNNGSFSPVVTAASTDTLTNKTLTSPTINSPITTLTAGHGTDDTYTGTVITGLNNSGGVTQWDTVYLNGSSQWVIADANGSGTFPARGLAIATATTGNAVNVLVHGTVRNDAWAWTPGGTIYLSGTAGGLTQTAPSTSGDKVQAVGFALTADIAFFDFNSTYVTVT